MYPNPAKSTLAGLSALMLLLAAMEVRAGVATDMGRVVENHLNQKIHHTVRQLPVVGTVLNESTQLRNEIRNQKNNIKNLKWHLYGERLHRLQVIKNEASHLAGFH